MTNTPAQPGLPPSLRLLKALVIVLMITMIVGVITVVWLLVTRMPDVSSLSSHIPTLPAELQLPEGVTPEAITLGKDWVAVVSSDQRLFVFNTDGTLRQEIMILAAP
jgi:hypothetical protein